MPIKLVVRTSDGLERSFPVAGERVVIGRESRCDVRVPLPTVEDRHCEILLADGTLELKDLNTNLGTLHNGDRVNRVVLRNRDRIGIGPCEIEVHIDGQSKRAAG